MAASIDAAALGESQEFQSARVRFALGGAGLLFLFAGDVWGHFSVDWQLVALLYGVHIAIFLGLFVWVLVRPAFHSLRTDCSILVDLSATTGLIYLSGDALAPFYLVYVVLFLSQGTRYGARNLTFAAAGGLICFTAVVAAMGGWAERPIEAGFVLLALTILPLYQYRLLRNLQAARRHAEHAKAARGEFLATMSHELRTPLAGILGMSRLLESTPLDREQHHCVESIGSAGNTLQMLIGDILDLSKIDAGGLELHPQHFELRPCLVAVARGLTDGAVERGIDVVCRIDPALPIRIHADRLRFEQILYNLVGNAVKFTRVGRVVLGVEAAPPDDELDQPHVRLDIVDTGPGIPQARLKHIFERFWQADTSASRAGNGTGLGTTIAQRLTLVMGGHIAVTSAMGQGTTFSVRLPCLPVDGPARAPQPPPVLAGRRVLIHAADEIARDALARTCRAAAMAVEFPGRDAVSAAAAIVVLADDPDGNSIRGWSERWRSGDDPPPVLYLTYAARLGHAPFAPDEVISRTLVQPWQPEELWSALAELAAPSGTSPEPDASTRASEVESTVPSRRILVVEDDPINSDLVTVVVERLGHLPVIIGDGPSALARLEDEAFDLALVDLRMPGMGGIDFARRLRAREAADRRMPTIALTADVTTATRARALAAGMDDVWLKPLDPGRLARFLADRVV